MNPDRIMSLTTQLLHGDQETRGQAAKGLVCLLWPLMRVVDRNEFRNRLDDDHNLCTRQTPIEVILWRWGWVVEQDVLTGWDAEFAKDLLKKRKWRDWTPSEKEEHHIRRIYREVVFGEKVEVLEKREA